MTGIYEQQLDKNDANFVALSPVSFVERSAEIFGDSGTKLASFLSSCWS